MTAGRSGDDAMTQQRLRPGPFQRTTAPGGTSRPYNLGGHIARMQRAKASPDFVDFHGIPPSAFATLPRALRPRPPNPGRKSRMHSVAEMGIQ